MMESYCDCGVLESDVYPLYYCLQGKQPVQRFSSPVKTVNDIVITANPRSPPLSVFILARMLATQCRVLLTTLVHSSARGLVGPHLVNAFETNGEMVTDRNSFSLGITVIWKDGKLKQIKI